MAYVSQELKQKLAPRIKAICKKYGVKASLAIHNHTALVLNIKEGKLDFIGNYNQHVINRDPTGAMRLQQLHNDIQVNVYHYQSQYTGKVLKFFEEIVPAMNVGNFDKSDSQSDYFHVGWYVHVNVGRWNKPYALVK